MWKSLLILAIVANLLIIVSSSPDSVYVVTVPSNASPIRVDCKEQIFDATSDARIIQDKTFYVHLIGDKGKVKDKHTIITTITKASSNSTADVMSDRGNTSVSAGAGAAASVTTIVKTHVHTMKKCASHEKYVKCPKNLCQPQNCEEVGVLVCSKDKHQRAKEESHEEESKEAHRARCGTPACFCIDDYVRIHGICRPVTECPECGGDKNATVGCGVNCGRRCSNYMKKNISCPDTDFICYENSCDCKQDYVFDDNTGKCVLPEDCSNKNAPNPEDGEGTPGSGEPEEGEQSCDNCNGNCAEQDNNEDEDSEDGGTKQNQCTTKHPNGAESSDGPGEGATKDMTTTGKSEAMSTPPTETSNETEEPKTTTNQKEKSTEGPQTTMDQTESGTEDLTTTGKSDEMTSPPIEASNKTEEPKTTANQQEESTEALQTTINQTESGTEDMTSTEKSDKMSTPSTETSNETDEPKTTTNKQEEGTEAPQTTVNQIYSGTEGPEDTKTTEKENDNTGEDSGCSGDPNAISGCDKECKNRCPGNEANICKCPENSCRCKEGYVFNPATYKCVKPEECGSSNNGEGTEKSTEESTPSNTENNDMNTESTSSSHADLTTISKEENYTEEQKTTTDASDEDVCPEDSDTNESKTASTESEMTSNSNTEENTKGPNTYTSQFEGGNCGKESETETTETTKAPSTTETTEEPVMETTTKRKHKPKKHKITTTMSPCSKRNTEDSDNNEPTEEIAMESTTKKRHKTKKHKTTTPTDEAANTENTEQNESEMTTADENMTPSSMMDKNTKQSSMHPGYGEKESATTEMTEESANESTNKKKHKTTATPDESTDSENPEENKSKMTSANPELTTSMMTEKNTNEPEPATSHPEYGKEETMTSKKDPHTEQSETEFTTMKSKITTMANSHEESKETTPSEKDATTEASDAKSTTMKQRRSRRPRTTTINSAEEMSTTRRPRRSRKPTTTPGEHAYSQSTKGIDEESKTKAPLSPESATTASTTTGQCNGRRERHHECASECPDYTCSDFLNHNITRCPRRHGSKNCKAGCRCRNGHYRNLEGKCVTGAHCRRQARSTTTASGTTKGESSTTEMSSTVQHSETCEEEAMQIFIRTNLEFTAKVLAERSLQSDDNVLIGGASILFLFGELALFASGESRNQLMEVLGLDSDQIKCFLPRLSANVTIDFSDVEYDLTCNVIADDSCALTNEFKDTTQDVFHIRPQNFNFSDEESAISLSDMVADVTGIEDFVTFDELSSLSSLVLFDAEVFKGEWMKPFDPRQTTELDFHGSDGKIKKTMMHQSAKFLYTESESLGCRVLKMKYKGGDFTMAIFLPNDIDGLDEMVQKLCNVDDVVSTLDSLRPVHVDAYIPKFNQITSSSLKVATTKTNVDRIFNEDSTGLKDVSSCEKPYVSDIIQTVSYVVDETGTGESPSTNSNNTADEPSNPHQRAHTTIFKADHPFAYYVIYRKIIIFGGTYVN